MFGVDLRSLAAFRIGLALMTIADLVMRAEDLGAHYADGGILPRSALLEKFGNVYHVSAHLMNGSAFFQGALFVIQGLIACALLVGHRTGLATALTWFLTISLHARNPVVLQAGDVLLRLLLFWGMFLPLGGRWSLDARRRGFVPEGPNHHCSLATAALLLQVAFVYWFTIQLKTGPEWWPNLTAVYYALNIDILATRFGVWIRQFGPVLTFFTAASLAVEALAPFLFFSPWKSAWTRGAAFLLLAGMHASFMLFMELGNFPWIDFISVLPLVPGPVWDYLERRRHGQVLETTGKGPRLGPFASGFVLLCLVVAFSWNVSTVPRYGVRLLPGWAAIGHILRLDQSWGMFAPFPVKDDGWFVVEGTLESGAKVDVRALDKSPASFEKPELVSAAYTNQRWRKYMMNLWQVSFKDHRLYYARFLCRGWNARFTSQDQLDEFHLYYMKELTLPDYRPSTLEKVDVWHHYCFR